MKKPYIGATIVVRNHGLGIGDAPGLVTRVWGDRCVNVHVLPDGGNPATKTSVPLYQSEADAADYLTGMPGHTPIAAFWPTEA